MPIIDFDSECWGDPWVQERTPLGKLLFVYLWTNTHRNVSGLYVITKKTMGDETGLTKRQIDDILEELKPKVKYDPEHCICWVVKHVRRQFLRRGTIISDQVKKGIRNAAIKLCYHPFFNDFMDEYPEIFNPEEKDILCRSSQDSHETVMRQSQDVPGKGGGKGKGGGSSFGSLESKKDILAISPKKEKIQKKGKIQPDYPEDFQKFWNAYPKEEKVGKEATFEIWKKLSLEDRNLLLKATESYGRSERVRQGFVKDPERFLKKNFWRDFIPKEKQEERQAWGTNKVQCKFCGAIYGVMENHQCPDDFKEGN